MSQLVSMACPWLMLVFLFQRAARWIGLAHRGVGLLVSAALAMALLVLPIGGVSIASRVAGVTVNFAVPFMGVLAVAIAEHALERTVFRTRDWTAAWLFGAVGVLVLYPLALGIGAADPYAWGWRLSPLFVVVGVITAWLIWTGSAFGVLLLLSAAALHLHLLESTNYWDYLLDPFYGLVSLTALGRRLAAGLQGGHQPPPGIP